MIGNDSIQYIQQIHSLGVGFGVFNTASRQNRYDYLVFLRPFAVPLLSEPFPAACRAAFNGRLSWLSVDIVLSYIMAIRVRNWFWSSLISPLILPYSIVYLPIHAVRLFVHHHILFIGCLVFLILSTDILRPVYYACSLRWLIQTSDGRIVFL